jgi:hypothetical protein
MVATTARLARSALRCLGQLSLGFALLCGHVSALDAAAPPTDPAVVAAQRRQDAVKSFAIEYKQTDVVSPGAISETNVGFASPTKGLIPPNEMTLTSVSRLVVDDDKVRFEQNHPIFQLPEGEVVEKGIVYLFNGTISNQFFPKGLGSSSNPRNDTPQGIIKANPIPAGIKLYETVPIFGVFRGLTPAMASWTYSDLKPTGVALSINGVSCQEYVKQISADLILSCWLNPIEDYLMRRVRIQRKGKLEAQLDIQYGLDEKRFWVPKAWKFNQFGPNERLQRSQTFEVLQVRVNESEATTQFDIQYPLGTEVNDQRTDQWYRIQSDGTMREFSRTTGEESFTTVVQPGAPWYHQHNWLLISVAVVAILAMALAYLQLKKRAKLRS